jgi:hypothetical protein
MTTTSMALVDWRFKQQQDDYVFLIHIVVIVPFIWSLFLRLQTFEPFVIAMELATINKVLLHTILLFLGSDFMFLKC